MNEVCKYPIAEALKKEVISEFFKIKENIDNDAKKLQKKDALGIHGFSDRLCSKYERMYYGAKLGIEEAKDGGHTFFYDYIERNMSIGENRLPPDKAINWLFGDGYQELKNKINDKYKPYEGKENGGNWRKEFFLGLTKEDFFRYIVRLKATWGAMIYAQNIYRNDGLYSGEDFMDPIIENVLIPEKLNPKNKDNEEYAVDESFENEKLEHRQRAIAFYYMAKELGVKFDDKLSAAKFFRFLSGKQMSKEMKGSAEHKAILRVFANEFNVQKLFKKKELEYVRERFEDIRATSIIQKIDRDLEKF